MLEALNNEYTDVSKGRSTWCLWHGWTVNLHCCMPCVVHTYTQDMWK